MSKNRNNIFIVFALTAIAMSCQETQYVQGQRLYNYFCANCHMEDGNGLVRVFPSLNNSDYLVEHADQLPCIIKNGLKGTIVVNGVTFDEPMPGYPNLSNAEISNICNYIFTAWNNKIEIQNINQIEGALKKCEL